MEKQTRSCGSSTEFGKLVQSLVFVRGWYEQSAYGRRAFVKMLLKRSTVPTNKAIKNSRADGLPKLPLRVVTRYMAEEDERGPRQPSMTRHDG